ncbi:MAG: hypothetical protein ACI9VS_002195 [Candidatus Binatia bacterium]|jgi:uncharacterized protein (TIRG00374 family)
MNKRLRILFLLIGLSVLGYFIYRTGWDEIWLKLSELGWLAPLCFLPFLTVFALDAAAWKISFGKHGTPGVSWWSMFKIRWAGESVNYVVPTAYVGGEAVKIYLLHKRGIDPKVSAAASVVSKSAQTLGMVIFIAIGAMLSLRYIPEGSWARQAMAIICVLTFVAIGALFLLQKYGMFTTLLKALRLAGIRIRKLEEQEEHLRRLDERTLSFYRDEKGAFFWTTFVFLLGWFCDCLEIWLVCWLFGLPLDFTQAFALEAFISVAKGVGMFSPGSIGVQESGIVFLFELFALGTSYGMAYAIIRRVRELIYGIIGWLLIYAEEGAVRGITARAKEDAQALE